jgi:hypothetical protein
VKFGIAIVAAPWAYGANVRCTVYADAGHDWWTLAYAEPELYSWLLGQRRTDDSSQQLVR